MNTTTKLLLYCTLMACVTIGVCVLLFQNSSNEQNYLALIFFASLPFMVNAIVELNSSTRIDSKEKTMWTFGFIVMPLIIGIAYLISQRKRVLLG